jgi:tRNA G18 (ribose-2'-O)-methylase SpoU
VSKRRKHLDAAARFERERRRNLLARPGPTPLVVVLDHLKAGFNVAKVFRSAQAFGVREVHLVRIRPFDPAPAKGALRVVPARFFDHLDHSMEALRSADYRIFRLAADDGPCLSSVELPLRCAFVLGHEEFGISAAGAELPAVRIPQVGQVQSLNVSIAASIGMYEYLRQYPTEVEWEGAEECLGVPPPKTL